MRACLLEVDLEELHELHNDYPLALDKLEFKREIFSDYQLKIADDYNISIGYVKKKCLISLTKKSTYIITCYKNLFQIRTKREKTSCITIWSSKMAKTIYRIYYTK